MAITPSTDLKLLKVNINIDERNQLTFATADAQYTYFNSLPKLEVDNFTYQRADGVIRYPAHIDTINTYNYCMYQNENYTNKWFYAFITGMRYINDNMTEISIKTDVWQTWGFDIEVGQSYVEREHVNDDTIGLHTYPEGLETGEYTIKESISGGLMPLNIATNVPGYYTIIMTSWNPFPEIPDGSRGEPINDKLNGISQGCGYIVFKRDFDINLFFKQMAEEAKNDAVVGAFVAPRNLFYEDATLQAIPDNWWTTASVQYGGGNPSTCYYKVISDGTINVSTTWWNNSRSILMATPTFYPNTLQLDGNYTPKNNKLFCWPYNFLEINNNGGGQAILRYEDFDYGTSAGVGQCIFNVIGSITPGCSITCIPKFYKNQTYNKEEGLPLGKLPICSYQVDMYTNWLTQNSLSMKIGVAENIFNIGSSIVKGDVGGAVGGLFGIAKTQAEIEKQKMVPPQTEGNTNSGDVMYSSGIIGYTFYKKCIKKEYAEKLDNFFSMFGYKINTTKVPNIYGRTYFNYVKTIDANVEGYIPQGDLQEIKDTLNNGITFWHDPDHFLDYSVTNSIVS